MTPHFTIYCPKSHILFIFLYKLPRKSSFALYYDPPPPPAILKKIQILQPPLQLDTGVHIQHRIYHTTHGRLHLNLEVSQMTTEMIESITRYVTIGDV